MSAGRQHHAPRPDVPEALTGDVPGCLGQVVGTALQGAEKVLVVVAEDGGARQECHLRLVGQCRDFAISPFVARQSVHCAWAVEQAAAKAFLFVGEDHACAGPGRLSRRRDTRRTAADHQHIAVHVHVVVGVGIRFGGQVPQPAARRMMGSHTRCHIFCEPWNIL